MLRINLAFIQQQLKMSPTKTLDDISGISYTAQIQTNFPPDFEDEGGISDSAQLYFKDGTIGYCATGDYDNELFLLDHFDSVKMWHKDEVVNTPQIVGLFEPDIIQHMQQHGWKLWWGDRLYGQELQEVEYANPNSNTTFEYGENDDT